MTSVSEVRDQPTEATGDAGATASERRRFAEVFPSVVVAVANAAHFIGAYLDRLAAIMEARFDQYEIILVDSGSRDATREVIAAAQERHRGVILLNLVRTRETNIALIAGLDHAIGDMAIPLDPKLDQPEIVEALVEKAVEGFDVVYALPRERVEAKGFSDILSNGFLSMLSRTERLDMPKEASSARLVSRAVLNFIVQSTDRHRTLMVAPALSGYPYASIIYDREYPGYDRPASERRGKSVFGRVGDVWRLFQRAIDVTFTISVKPLRFVSALALFISTLSVLYSIYVIFIWMVMENVASGWVSTSLQISGLFFLTSIVLAVMSEYLLQVLESTGRRPLYYLSGRSQSDALTYDERLNVLRLGERDSDAKGGAGAEEQRNDASTSQ